MRKNSREDFLNSVRTIIEYWGNQDHDKHTIAQGTAFSIMCLLDGVCTDNLYGYEVIDNETGQHITDGFNELHADL